ncbi:Ricin-type beta-trefoil lectin domain-containing protein [Streptomyces sp. Ag82_O1-12]|uniref:RICIN domain-containing protein n=1 Tax=unclassified Streptomyces TaxID=2593676 RepID=UPI000BD7C64E|nr:MULTISPECIES: RICIN domain-containing protein [unclassified Streptomyces]SMQ14834.1 Ricin-type beta-trefoil lectin domain-containing protein [Streptomyces sp. Ag82_O1-12]SOD43862.1 Ricin-type beta-trefoil lectin domain-containing protein [Streptomyces sp. Ag82_G6-1]
MQSPNPPRPPYPPRPGAGPAESDRNLLARVGEPAEGPRAVALLLARHWRAVYEYAVICLASSEDSASMAAAAAFRRELARPGGGALRPRLLTAVRETVGEWAADDGISTVLPELRKTVGARGLRAARPGTPERRRLAERAFRGLPGASQCLLWHAEVEAESISVPAGLLGVDAATASAALEQAREQFRTGCVRAHRELAPTQECRHYNRLLDVPMRRGGALLPDVQRHLMACRYCRHAAEQLSHFEGGLEDLLVETVLGWGARRYLESRPGRDEGRPVLPAGGRHRLRPRDLPATGLPGAPRRHTKALAAAIGVTSLVLLATLLAARGWTEESGTADPQVTWGAVSGHSVAPDSVGPSSVEPDSTRSSSEGSPSAASVDSPAEVARGRLRNLDGSRCLDVLGGRIRADARIVLAACSSGGSQLWSYQDDGVLRSAADPTLCLGSDTAEGSVVLAGCLVHAGVVRYDLTVRGELLPRGAKGLAVAPGKGRDVIVTGRDGSEAQRWALEPAAAPGGSGESRKKRTEDAPRESSGQRTRRPHDDAPPGRPDTGSGDLPQERYEARFAQVGCCEDAEPGADQGVTGPGPDVIGPATATVADAVTTVHSLAPPVDAVTAVRSVALP